MSGGHFDYQQFHMQEISDSIDEYINGRELDDDEVREIFRNRWTDADVKQYVKEHKHSVPNCCGYSDETIAEFKKGIAIIRMAYVYAQRIDWLLSCDDDEESFHSRLKEELAGINHGEYVPLLDDLLNGKAMIVDTNWLNERYNRIINKAWAWISEGTSTFGVLKDDFYNRMKSLNMDRKIVIRECINASENIRKYLVSNGMQKDEAKKSTKHYYKTYKRGFKRGAELQLNADIDKACEILSQHNTESGIMISIEEFRKAMEQ